MSKSTLIHKNKSSDFNNMTKIGYGQHKWTWGQWSMETSTLLVECIAT